MVPDSHKAGIRGIYYLLVVALLIVSWDISMLFLAMVSTFLLEVFMAEETKKEEKK